MEGFRTQLVKGNKQVVATPKAGDRGKCIHCKESVKHNGVWWEHLNQNAEHHAEVSNHWFPRFDDKERAKNIAEAYSAGQTLRAIGGIYGISYERVRQILRKYEKYNERIEIKWISIKGASQKLGIGQNTVLKLYKTLKGRDGITYNRGRPKQVPNIRISELELKSLQDLLDKKFRCCDCGNKIGETITRSIRCRPCQKKWIDGEKDRLIATGITEDNVKGLVKLAVEAVKGVRAKTFVELKEICKILGLSKMQSFWLCRRGVIPGIDTDRIHQVTRKPIKNYSKEHAEIIRVAVQKEMENGSSIKFDGKRCKIQRNGQRKHVSTS